MTAFSPNPPFGTSAVDAGDCSDHVSLSTSAFGARLRVGLLTD